MVTKEAVVYDIAEEDVQRLSRTAPTAATFREAGMQPLRRGIELIAECGLVSNCETGNLKVTEAATGRFHDPRSTLIA